MMYPYPSDRQLAELKDKANELPLNYDGVIERIRELWNEEYGKIIDTHIVMSQIDPIGHILITGGWSGNEDILGALAGTMFDMTYWYSSERGGKHTYRREP